MKIKILGTEAKVCVCDVEYFVKPFWITGRGPSLAEIVNALLRGEEVYRAKGYGFVCAFFNGFTQCFRLSDDFSSEDDLSNSFQNGFAVWESSQSSKIAEALLATNVAFDCHPATMSRHRFALRAFHWANLLS